MLYFCNFYELFITEHISYRYYSFILCFIGVEQFVDSVILNTACIPCLMLLLPQSVKPSKSKNVLTQALTRD